MATSTKFADGYIALTLDLKEYREGLKKAKGEAETVGQQIRSAISTPKSALGSATFKSPIANIIADLRVGLPLAQTLRTHLGVGLARDLGKLTLAPFNAGLGAARTGLTAIQGLAGRITGAFRALGPILQGIGVGIGLGAFLSLERVIGRLVQAIPDLVTAGRNYANEVDQVVDVTGAATEESSKLVAALNFLGQDVSTVFIRLGQLSKTVQENEVELNALGVTTRDTNGEFLNQVRILDSIRSAFSKLPDGLKKTRLEVLLFGGRGGLGQLVDLLQLTDEQWTLLGQHFDEQGLLISESQRQMGESALRAQKDIENAYTGLATQLFNAVGPQVIAFLAGISKAITDNATQIVAFVSSIVNTIIGLIQGLTGLSLNFNSVAVAVQNMNKPVSESSFLLSEIDGKIADLQKSLKAGGGEAANFNAGIDRQIRALQDDGRAIDAQIKKLDRLGATQERAFRKGIDSLQKTLDLQLSLLDAEDQRLSRAERDEDLRRSAADAERGVRDAIRGRRDAIVDLADAQAQLRKDEIEGAADLAKARASGADGAEIADIQIKNQETHENNIRAIIKAQEDLLNATESVADAQRGVADAGAAVTEEGRRRAEEDRRAQIAGLQTYVDNVARIAEEENKTAAATTLRKREELLKQRQAEQAALGNTQAVADTQVQIDAVMAAEKKVAADIARATEQTALEKRKADLEAEIDAFRNSKTTQSTINKAEINKQIADLQRQRAVEVAAIAKRNQEAEFLANNLHELNLETGKSYDSTFGAGGAIPAAFEASRAAGVAMADGIKKAIGEVIDVLFGEESKSGHPTGAGSSRKGGLLGALAGITGAMADIAGGLGDLLSGARGITGKDIGLAIAIFGATRLSLPIAAAGLALYGVASYAELSSTGGSNSNAQDWMNETRPGFPQPLPQPVPAPRATPANPNAPTGPMPGPSFAHGGLVPGSRDRALLATVHGGEYVIPSDIVARMQRAEAAPVFAGGGGGTSSGPAVGGDGYVMVKASSVMTENQMLDWLMPRMRQRRS